MLVQEVGVRSWRIYDFCHNNVPLFSAKLLYFHYITKKAGRIILVLSLKVTFKLRQIL